MTRIAILGCGKIARTMAATLRGMRDQGEAVCLYAAASRTLETAQAFAAQEGFEVAYGSYEEMVQDPQVDLVYIASPHSHHAEHMKLCIEHGKAVLCEKSFTANAKQAREVLALAKEKKVLVTEAIWTRYMPSRRIIDEVIASGAIGKPELLQANLYYSISQVRRIVEPELAGGALLDVGVYPINFCSMAFGNDFVRMESSVLKTETGVDRDENITLYYADGRAAHLSAGIACRSDRRCLISGTEGYLVVDNVNNPTQITLYRQEDDFAHGEDIPVPEQISGYEYEVRACMKALAEGALECPDMPHSETIRIMEIMDALRESWGIRYPFE